MAKRTKEPERPGVAVLEAELKRVKSRGKYRKRLGSVVVALVVVGAVAVAAATLWMPVLRVYGGSMAPTLRDGQIVVALKTAKPEPGDLVAFYLNEKILIKRVIGRSGDWVNLQETGEVFVNGTALEEPYLEQRDVGDCNVEMPYQVPEGRLFVMGDHRSVSVDSRNTAVGCVAEEQLLGKVVFRIWPLEELGSM